jgi:hypothetical protein
MLLTGSDSLTRKAEEKGLRRHPTLAPWWGKTGASCSLMVIFGLCFDFPASKINIFFITS